MEKYHPYTGVNVLMFGYMSLSFKLIIMFMYMHRHKWTRTLLLHVIDFVLLSQYLEILLFYPKFSSCMDVLFS